MRKEVSQKNEALHISAPAGHILYNFVDHTLQGVLYKKDITITSAKFEKLYSDNPRTEIKITRLNHE